MKVYSLATYPVVCFAVACAQCNAIGDNVLFAGLLVAAAVKLLFGHRFLFLSRTTLTWPTNGVFFDALGFVYRSNMILPSFLLRELFSPTFCESDIFLTNAKRQNTYRTQSELAHDSLLNLNLNHHILIFRFVFASIKRQTNRELDIAIVFSIFFVFHIFLHFHIFPYFEFCTFCLFVIRFALIFVKKKKL